MIHTCGLDKLFCMDMARRNKLPDRAFMSLKDGIWTDQNVRNRTGMKGKITRMRGKTLIVYRNKRK